jgi:hypothetical protein
MGPWEATVEVGGTVGQTGKTGQALFPACNFRVSQGVKRQPPACSSRPGRCTETGRTSGGNVGTK